MLINSSVRFSNLEVLINSFFMNFGSPKVPYFGPFLERFRPENCKKGPIFFGALRAPNSKISEVLINSSVRFSYFSEVLCSMGGGVINSITVVSKTGVRSATASKLLKP